MGDNGALMEEEDASFGLLIFSSFSDAEIEKDEEEQTLKGKRNERKAILISKQ